MKWLPRLVACLLVPCLIADPVSATLARPDVWRAGTAPTAHQTRFDEQAFAARLIANASLFSHKETSRSQAFHSASAAISLYLTANSQVMALPGTAIDLNILKKLIIGVALWGLLIGFGVWRCLHPKPEDTTNKPAPTAPPKVEKTPDNRNGTLLSIIVVSLSALLYLLIGSVQSAALANPPRVGIPKRNPPLQIVEHPFRRPTLPRAEANYQGYEILERLEKPYIAINLDHAIDDLQRLLAGNNRSLLSHDLVSSLQAQLIGVAIDTGVSEEIKQRAAYLIPHLQIDSPTRGVLPEKRSPSVRPAKMRGSFAAPSTKHDPSKKERTFTSIGKFDSETMDTFGSMKAAVFDIKPKVLRDLKNLKVNEIVLLGPKGAPAYPYGADYLDPAAENGSVIHVVIPVREVEDFIHHSRHKEQPVGYRIETSVPVDVEFHMIPQELPALNVSPRPVHLAFGENAVIVVRDFAPTAPTHQKSGPLALLMGLIPVVFASIIQSKRQRNADPNPADEELRVARIQNLWNVQKKVSSHETAQKPPFLESVKPSLPISKVKNPSNERSAENKAAALAAKLQAMVYATRRVLATGESMAPLNKLVATLINKNTPGIVAEDVWYLITGSREHPNGNAISFLQDIILAQGIVTAVAKFYPGYPPNDDGILASIAGPLHIKEAIFFRAKEILWANPSRTASSQILLSAA